MSIIRKAIPFALLLAGAASALDPLYWYYYEVDTTGDFRGYSSITYDAKGGLQVAYRGTSSVKYAKFDGKKWNRELVSTETEGDSKLVLATDSSGAPHIIFQDVGDLHFLHAKKTGDKWETSVLDTGGHAHHYEMSITSDPAGTIHVLYNKYYDNAYAGVTYNNFNGDNIGGPQNICHCGYAGKWNDIIINSAGNPAVVYFHDDLRWLTFATLEKGTWTSYPLDSITGQNLQGYYGSMAQDTSGTYYIAAQAFRYFKLNVVYGKPGGTWTVENLDTLDGYTTFTSPSSLVLARGGIPHVIYARLKKANSETNEIQDADLIMAYKDGGTWKYQAVDTTGKAGEYASSAVSPQGLPVISYTDRDKRDLRVAIASLTPPPDDNHNGIPDYQEPVAIRPRANPRSPKPALKKLKGAAVFDSRGKTLEPGKGGKATLASGVYILPAAAAGNADNAADTDKASVSPSGKVVEAD